MGLMFWQAPRPRAVTPTITRYLVTEFGVGPELLSKLRVLEKNGKFSNRKVRMVRVFDPELVAAGVGSTVKYDDLGVSGNGNALRFEGRFEKDGSLYLGDRRPKAGG